LSDSITKKLIKETATKLRKLKQEFSSKIKSKALEKANQQRETFNAKKQEMQLKYKSKMA
jgi:hypothetical protein